jgi:hypothetical protein
LSRTTPDTILEAVTSTALPRATVSRKGVARVAVYYVVLAMVGLLLIRFSPWVREAVAGANLGVGASDVFGAGGAPPVGAPIGDSAWEQALLATISMLAALAVMLPVTWVYLLTREEGYDESVVHSMLILPVAVTGIVMVVKSSVALAFSLAGIVAAVRFRTSLDDTKDAVYIFLAIGVGLAAGIQALGIAIALSVVFNAVVLTLWGTRFGNVHATSGAGALGIGGVLAHEGAAVGTGRSFADISAALERQIQEDRAKSKEKRSNSLILVHAKAAGPAQALVDDLLERHAARWKLAEIGPGPGGTTLAYLARLEGSAPAAVMDSLRNGADGAVERAELRSLKGIKPAE